MTELTIGVIGAGQMATAIIKGIQRQTDYQIKISNSSEVSSLQKAAELGVEATESHQQLIAESDIILLAVKPQQLVTALDGLVFHQPVLSVIAGVSIGQLEDLLGSNLPICRLMPNLNAQILKSSTALCVNRLVTSELYQLILTIAESFGKVFPIPEEQFDAFTVLAGSSPAFMAQMLDTMASVGVKYGFSKTVALNVITETLIATGQNLLQEQELPATFINRVSSPGGITIEGLLTMEKTGLSAALIQTLEASIEKSSRLMRDKSSS